jgi:hypothetical protein
VPSNMDNSSLGVRYGGALLLCAVRVEECGGNVGKGGICV